MLLTSSFFLTFFHFLLLASIKKPVPPHSTGFFIASPLRLLPDFPQWRAHPLLPAGYFAGKHAKIVYIFQFFRSLYPCTITLQNTQEKT